MSVFKYSTQLIYIYSAACFQTSCNIGVKETGNEDRLNLNVFAAHTAAYFLINLYMLSV